MAIILGIDPGTAITGFGVIESRRDTLTARAFGVIRTASSRSTPERLEEIYAGLEEVQNKYDPNSAAVEKLFFNDNVKTAMSVGQARGVAILACARSGTEIREYTPLQIKQAVCGYGRAEKRQVQRMVKSLLNLKETPRPDDAADALAVAICHAYSRRFQSALEG